MSLLGWPAVPLLGWPAVPLLVWHGGALCWMFGLAVKRSRIWLLVWRSCV